MPRPHHHPRRILGDGRRPAAGHQQPRAATKGAASVGGRPPAGPPRPTYFERGGHGQGKSPVRCPVVEPRSWRTAPMVGHFHTTGACLATTPPKEQRTSVLPVGVMVLLFSDLPRGVETLRRRRCSPPPLTSSCTAATAFTNWTTPQTTNSSPRCQRVASRWSALPRWEGQRKRARPASTDGVADGRRARWFVHRLTAVSTSQRKPARHSQQRDT